MNYNKCINKLKETMGKCFKEKQTNKNNVEVGNRFVTKLIKKLKKYRKRGKAQRCVADAHINKIKELLACLLYTSPSPRDRG